MPIVRFSSSQLLFALQAACSLASNPDASLLQTKTGTNATTAEGLPTCCCDMDKCQKKLVPNCCRIVTGPAGVSSCASLRLTTSGMNFCDATKRREIIPREGRLLPGDVVFLLGKSLGHAATAGISGSDISHVMIVTDVVPSEFLQQELENAGLNVIVKDSTYSSGTRATWLWNSLGHSARFRTYRMRGLTQQGREKVLAWLETKVGKSYDKMGFVQTFLPSFTNSLTNLVGSGEDTWFSAELAAAALQQSGEIPSLKAVDPNSLRPGDLEDILQGPRVPGGLSTWEDLAAELVFDSEPRVGRGALDGVMTVPTRMMHRWQVVQEVSCEFEDGSSRKLIPGTKVVAQHAIRPDYEARRIGGYGQNDPDIWLKVVEAPSGETAECLGAFLKLFGVDMEYPNLELDIC